MAENWIFLKILNKTIAHYTSQAVMLAVKSGNVEIKHGKSEVGQIKLEKWVSKCLIVHARRWGQQRNIIRGELEHENNFLLVWRLFWGYFCFIGHNILEEKKGRKGKIKVVTADSFYLFQAFPNSH